MREEGAKAGCQHVSLGAGRLSHLLRWESGGGGSECVCGIRSLLLDMWSCHLDLQVETPASVTLSSSPVKWAQPHLPGRITGGQL